MARNSNLLVRNSNDVVILRMRKADGSGAITDAVLTCTITDPNDTQIDSFSLSHEGDGDYRGATTAQLTAGITYKVVVTASNYTFERIAYWPAIEPEV